MSDILSPDEVDALLKGVAEGSVTTGADGSAAGGIRTLDLTSQERSLRGRLPGLELLLDRLARGLRASLATFFGQLPQVSVESVELVKYGTLTARLPRPVSLVLFRLAPLRGQGLLVVTPPLVSALLQVFFGGSPSRGTPVAEREFSPIEQRVLERLGLRVLHELRDAWRPVEPIECGMERSETNPQFATIATPQDLVLLIELRVVTEGSADGGLLIGLPNAALDPVRARLALLPTGEVTPADEATAWGERLRASLALTEVEVSAELGTRELPLRSVLNLKVGDLLPLGTGREGPVVVRVAGRPRFLGAPGIASGNNAVRVTARL